MASPIRVVCSLALLVLAVGCGGEKIPMGTVSGTVLVDGKPYGNADVMFLGMENGQAASGSLAEDGSFKLLEALPVGTYRVYLAPKPGEPDAPPQPVKIDESVNEKFWNETTSDIDKPIEEGSNEITIEFTK